MGINIQPAVTKYPDNNGEMLQVHSIFPTIQGEGVLVGTPSVFVRLYGCNLQCPMCDTDYTSVKEELSCESIIDEVVKVSRDGGIKTVVITGGEPFNQDINKLVKGLVAKVYQVQIETNGTIYREDFDYDNAIIVCSPKTPNVHKKLQPHITHYKYVGGEDGNTSSDGLPHTVLGLNYRKEVFRPDDDAIIYLQPVDSCDEVLNKQNLGNVISSCMDNNYTLCLQTHKMIGVE